MRKIRKTLLDRLTHGDLNPLLEYIRSSEELRLEVRTLGEAFVYYRKGKALEIGRMKADKKYGNVPEGKLAISDPAQYFRDMKMAIDGWLCSKKERGEFDTQQNIARWNKHSSGKYLVLDMEYAFEQNQIAVQKREKKAVFDLIGLDMELKRIVFFEVKKGMGATKGKSGIQEHIQDFNTYLFGENQQLFRANLMRDIKQIIADKNALGILDYTFIPKDFENSDPELVFVLHPYQDSEIKQFTQELNNRYKLITVNDEDFVLR